LQASRRSIRAQMLMQALNASSNAAARDDYLNAVTEMRKAAASTNFKLPPSPFGVPDIIRGEVWKKWRNYYHNHIEKVHAHVSDVLAKLSSGDIEVGPQDE